MYVKLLQQDLTLSSVIHLFANVLSQNKKRVMFNLSGVKTLLGLIRQLRN